MRRLDRYLAKEMIVPFIIGTLSVVLMFQANTIIALYKDLNMNNVPAVAVAQFIFYKTPSFLQMTIPVGTALAASLTMTRLARDSELTAMRAAGISILRVIMPVIVAGMAMAAANFFVTEKVMPRAESAARRLGQDVGMLALSPPFKANVVVELKTFIATFGTVSRGKDDEVLLTNIMLIERRPSGETLLITAPRGTYREGDWEIVTPLARLMRDDVLLTAKPSGNMSIHEPIRIADFFQTPGQEEMSIPALQKLIASQRKLRQPTASLEITLYSRYSIPAACLVFALCGAVFAVVFARRGPFAGVMLSMLMVMLYFNAYVISTQILGRLGWISPLLAAWLPNIIFLVLSLFALRRSE
jgi:lipopolysaccharide export system permease protein